MNKKSKKILKYIFSKENFEDLYDNPNISSLDEFKKDQIGNLPQRY